MARSKAVSIKDVAAECDVSATTVSLILNDRADEFRIAPATRERVLEAAESLGYKPPRGSRKRSPVARSALWCIFAPVDFASGPTSELFAGVREYALENDVAVETILFPYERGQLADKASWISRQFCHGAIVAGQTDADDEYVENAQFDVPIVVFNRSSKSHASVNIDNYAVGQRAMRHLYGRGHRRFGVVAPPHSSRPMSLRSVGFEDELQGAAGDITAAEVVTVRGSLSHAGGAEAVEQLYREGPGPTAIFVLNDVMVGGLIRELSARGLTVPDDVEVVTFGDMPINTILRPTVTSFAFPMQEMSRECARILHQAAAAPDRRDAAVRMFDAEFVVRESSPAETG
ncbi:LacI family DNA-binding transcriptional regulator [Demequina muriae]|uniref:LacI family DNA-binding transcriptional regulator n=1 Tax=Demequina muriae TaxID=3051664 RepID=A0ABT8GGJ6_9MICO|nr:LacI family DNA-binding transcriptional regulator [Demequina sp. EGI L300058]MDN4480560.1 LacI family DNA-binding transcriptional regulator [Demequina sp. EGI L300058]